MTLQNESINKRDIEQELMAFGEVMSTQQFDMMEKMNRTNKGELFVLRYLTMRNDAALPSELSAALHSSTGRISALLGTLETKGQIERNINKRNRRNILVTVTEAGRERVKTEMAKMRNSMTLILAEMGESDTLEFLRLSKRFFEIAQKYMIEYVEDEAEGVKSK
jgi:DNA-binding MarR family transcriptional regulator